MNKAEGTVNAKAQKQERTGPSGRVEAVSGWEQLKRQQDPMRKRLGLSLVQCEAVESHEQK